MKLIIAGSRDITDFTVLIDALVEVYDSGFLSESKVITEIVSNNAKGPDRLGEEYAKRFSIAVKKFIPDWDGRGKSAGMQRNSEMGQYADAAVVLWDGKSRGTKHMIDVMRRLNKPCYVRIIHEAS